MVRSLSHSQSCLAQDFTLLAQALRADHVQVPGCQKEWVSLQGRAVQWLGKAWSGISKPIGLASLALNAQPVCRLGVGKLSASEKRDLFGALDAANSGNINLIECLGQPGWLALPCMRTHCRTPGSSEVPYFTETGGEEGA